MTEDELKAQGTAKANKFADWIKANPIKFWGFVAAGVAVLVILVL